MQDHLEAIDEIRRRYRIGGLPVWVVYKNPRNCPGKIVVRCQIATERGIAPEARAFVYDKLSAARAPMRRAGLCQLPRSPGDDPVIIESWI